MTRDELIERVFQERNELDAEAQRLRLERINMLAERDALAAENAALKAARITHDQAMMDIAWDVFNRWRIDVPEPGFTHSQGVRFERMLREAREALAAPSRDPVTPPVARVEE